MLAQINLKPHRIELLSDAYLIEHSFDNHPLSIFRKVYFSDNIYNNR